MSTQLTTPSRLGPAERAVLASLGNVQAVLGLWALLWPGSNYRDFPFGRGWVALMPAYNEHLMRDVGAAFLALGALLLIAAWRPERRLAAAAAATFLIFSLPHAVFHLVNLEPFEPADAVANAIVLGAAVLLPAWVLLQLRIGRSPRAAARPSPPGWSGRIAPVADGEGGVLARLAFRESRRRFGGVMDPMRVMAHHPKLLAGVSALEFASERSNAVPRRLKHLAELRAAMVCGCEWCLDFGSAISRGMGVQDADLQALPAYEVNGHFDELETVVLDYATAMSRSPADVPEELVARLASLLDETQLVELTSIIALENYRARFNWALGLGSQGFAEGGVCLSPETRTQVIAEREGRPPGV